MMKKLLALTALGALSLCILSCYGYSRVDSNKYSNSSEKDAVQDKDFRVIGAGTFNYAGLFKVYDVILYATTAQVDHTSTPLFLEFHYLRQVSKETSVQATEQAILLNTTPAEVQSFGADWKTLLSFYENVIEGDTLIIRHDQSGLHLHYRQSGKHISINNHALAECLCAIWLGPQPLNLKLRNALLGRVPL